MRHIVIMGLLLVCSLQLKAQIDPTLAGMVYLYTEKAEDQLKANGSSTTTSILSATSSAMRHRYTASTTR